MNNIYKPKAKKVNGKFQIRFQYGRGENGAYRYKRISASTQKEVYRRYDEFLLRHGMASNSIVEKQSVYSYVKNWGELYYKSTVKEQTYIGFLNALESRIKPFDIAKMQMTNISIDMLQRYIQELLVAGYSRDTICKTWRYLSRCLQNGIDKGELSSIPLKLIKLPAEENVTKKRKEIIPFSFTDIEKLKSESTKQFSNGKPKYLYGNAILLLLNTGLRIGELLALTWSDIDLKNNYISVNKTLQIIQDKNQCSNKKTKEIVGPPKTIRSKRRVVINKTAKDILLQIKKSNKYHCEKTDRVILSSKFTTPSKRNISRCLEEITKNAEISINSGALHRLRHTYATMFINMGIPISFISNQLGHAKESTTRNIYISYLPEEFNKDKELFQKL